jgi:PAS domain S-box-containing protein
MDGLLKGLGALLDTRMLNPHGICLLWRPELIWTHAVSDTLIGLAYFSIPLALAAFLYRRRDIRFGWVVWMFVGFILLCGVTHFLAVATLWTPIYGIEALVKVATAAASLLTAVALWPLLPKAMAIPSSHLLQARIRERDAANDELREAMAHMVLLEEHQRQLGEALMRATSSEARLRSIFENAAVGIARVGLDGRFLEINNCFCDIVGWPREALLDGDFQRITHPDDLGPDLAQLDTLINGRANSFSMEKRYLRPDGSAVWAELTVGVARDAEGKPDHLVSIIEDISEQKRMAEARDLLMREVDHRARNSLTVVQSIVRLTPAIDPARFREAVIGRVDSLARAQGLLAQASWSGGSLAQLVRQELGSQAPEPQWEAEGPDIRIAPEAVQPLSMVLHELATNALKYGALSSAAGRVTVRWAEQRGRWRLTWEETGGPDVAAPARTGFGARLMTRLAAELRGEIAFDWRAGGLAVELSGMSGQVSPAPAAVDVAEA